MNNPRIMHIEFEGDPESDKENYKRYCGAEPFTSGFPGCEVIKFVEYSALLASQAQVGELIEQRKELATLMDSLVWAANNHLSSVGMTFSSKTILREKLEEIQKWVEPREALARHKKGE